MKHEDSQELFNEKSFDKDTILMKTNSQPTCDICNEKVHETFGVEEDNTTYITVEYCIICFAHKYGTDNAVRLQQTADTKRGYCL